MEKVSAFVLSIVLMVMVACNDKRNRAIYNRLSQWDSISMQSPRAINDSLMLLDPHKLSCANRAYYGLLQTIAEDRSFIDFTSDSLINSVCNYYHQHNPLSNNHIRALICKSIVRMHMGITDSTAFAPLKKADKLYRRIKNPDIDTGYFLYYYLGNVYLDNYNFHLAEKNLQKSLCFAKNKNHNAPLFYIYLALCWNSMEQEKYSKARLYLDTLQDFSNIDIDKKISLIDAKVLYYDTQDEYAKSFQNRRKAIRLLLHIKQKIKPSHFYSVLSNRYSNINQLDSALHYALLAVENIKDSMYLYNYLFYEDVADIAEKRHDYKMANDYRKKAAAVHEKTIKQETDKRILEFDKQYDLTEAENKALKAETRNKEFLLAIISLLLTILAAFFYYRRKQKITVLMQEKNEMEKCLIARELHENKRMVKIVTPYLQQHARQQQTLYAFSNTIRGRNGALADAFDVILKNGEQRLNKITKHIFTDEKMNRALGITSGLSLFNHTDRILLFMLTSGASNQQIAGLLNSTPENVKAKKSYLKKKIQQHASHFNNPDYLLSLFTVKKSAKNNATTP